MLAVTIGVGGGKGGSGRIGGGGGWGGGRRRAGGGGKPKLFLKFSFERGQFQKGLFQQPEKTALGWWRRSHRNRMLSSSAVRGHQPLECWIVARAFRELAGFDWDHQTLSRAPAWWPDSAWPRWRCHHSPPASSWSRTLASHWEHSSICNQGGSYFNIFSNVHKVNEVNLNQIIISFIFKFSTSNYLLMSLTALRESTLRKVKIWRRATCCEVNMLWGVLPYLSGGKWEAWWELLSLVELARVGVAEQVVWEGRSLCWQCSGVSFGSNFQPVLINSCNTTWGISRATHFYWYNDKVNDKLGLVYGVGTIYV